MNYREFLETKIELATESGFVIDPAELNPALKPHQRDAVAWALKGGRRALFESFGLGKTVQELEFCRQAIRHAGYRALIVCPLGVKQEFQRDAVQVLGQLRRPEEEEPLLHVRENAPGSSSQCTGGARHPENCPGPPL